MSESQSSNSTDTNIAPLSHTARPEIVRVLATEEKLRTQRELSEERVAALVADAYTLAQRGDYPMAIRLAQEAAFVLPDSTTPYAALAGFYERSGQKEQAIEAQERVVRLNPDSDADLLKLATLTGVPAKMAVRTTPIPAIPKKQTGWILYTAMTAIFVSVCGLIYVAIQQSEPANRPKTVSSPITNDSAANTAVVTERTAPNISSQYTPPMLPPALANPTPLPATPIYIRTQPLIRTNRRSDTAPRTANRPRRPHRKSGTIVPGIGQITSSSEERATVGDALPRPGDVNAGITNTNPKTVNPIPLPNLPKTNENLSPPANNGNNEPRPYIYIKVHDPAGAPSNPPSENPDKNP